MEWDLNMRVSQLFKLVQTRENTNCALLLYFLWKYCVALSQGDFFVIQASCSSLEECVLSQMQVLPTCTGLSLQE